MKKRFGIVCVLLLLTAVLTVSAFSADLVPNDVFKKGTFTASDGTKLPFRYYLPENYDTSTEKYPVLLYMHGNGSRGSDNTTQLTNTAGEIVKLVLNSKYDCIIIAPQCPASPKQWVTDYPCGKNFANSLSSGVYTADEYLNAASELLNRVITKHKVDTKRVYITGCSNGGGATWSLVARHPNVFAAAVPFAGTGKSGQMGYASNIASHYVGTPIWTFHGDADATLSVEGTREMVNAIKAAGGTIKYTEVAGGDHGFWVEAANTSGLVDWIFKQSNTDFANTLPGAVDPNTTLVNTKVRKGADPWLFKYNDYYYLVMTGGTAIHCRKAKTISGLATAGIKGLYSSLTDPTVEERFGKGAELSGTWSPEIYYFSEEEAPGNSGWYMYLALREATGDSSSIQMVVLKSTTDQPDGPYGHPITGERYHSQMIQNWPDDLWGCGQGMLKIPTGPYKGLYTTFVTEIGRGQSGSAGDFYQQIKISKMENPWTLTGSIGTVTEPTQEWECVGASSTHPRVVEGATAVYGKYGDVYITYSGSGYWATYGLGQLTWNGGNPINQSSWVKLSDTASYPNPIFTSRSVSFLTGAGHASFVADEEGNGFFCYHAYPSTSSGKINDPATGEPYRNAYIEPYYIDYSKSNGSGVANTGVLVLGYKKDRSPKDPEAIDTEMNFVSNGSVFKLEPAAVTATPGTNITLTMSSTGAKGYAIYRKVGSGDYEQLARTNSTIYIDKDVKADTTYSYIAYAFRNEEIAAQSNEVSAEAETRTLWDVLLILRYLTGETAGISQEKADIDGDGTVSLKDAIQTLKSSLNG